MNELIEKYQKEVESLKGEAKFLDQINREAAADIVLGKAAQLEIVIADLNCVKTTQGVQNEIN